MRIVVVTGMSGSGKSTALKALEDIGYYAIDNLPIALLASLLELFRVTSGEVQKIALVADARGAHDPGQVPHALDAARQAGHEVEILYLHAADEVVARRYSETRRRHPLATDGRSLTEGIAEERKLLMPLRVIASRTFDTTGLSVHDLKREVRTLYSATSGSLIAMGVSVVSFGYRHGVPSQADLVFDVRFLPNPYFVEELRDLTGESEACADYVLERQEAKDFLEKLEDLLSFLLPKYEDEGKAYVTIAVGCTGGQHRSVAITKYLAGWLQEQGRYVRVQHRDMPSLAP